MTKNKKTEHAGAKNGGGQVLATSWNSSKSEKSGLEILAKESAKQKRVLSPRETMEKGGLKTMLQRPKVASLQR